MRAEMVLDAMTCDTTSSLVALPDELLLEVSEYLLAADLPSLLRLQEVCSLLHSRLQPTRSQAEARRLYWVPELTKHMNIFGRELRCAEVKLEQQEEDTPLNRIEWASGPLLPVTGRSAWQMEVAHPGEGDIEIGICDAAARCRWCLGLFHGKLWQFTRTADGFFDQARTLPDNFPSGGHRKQICRPCSRFYRHCWPVPAPIERVEVIVDHDAGALSFRVDDGPVIEALTGFPPGAALRPAVGMTADSGDPNNAGNRVCLVRGFF